MNYANNMVPSTGFPWLTILVFLLLGFLSFNGVLSLQRSISRQTYIVQTLPSAMPKVFTSPTNWYTSTLASVLHSDDSAKPAPAIDSSLIYTYRFATHGFAARLTLDEAASIANVSGFLSILPDKLYQLQTTYTPEFMGLNAHSGLWPNASYGDDVIIGILDTGVWPESESFNDTGMSPIPARWKGTCIGGLDFNPSLCNKKLIGAKYFISDFGDGISQLDNNTTEVVTEYKSPRDIQGHGTHTASTAAGTPVHNASFFGYANGTARGVAPKARIAVYKVCWASLGGCLGADLLAGMDEAVSDGVNVLSISLGGQDTPFFEDPLAVGAFGALVDHGVLVTCAAGNQGPVPGSVINVAPWLLTVAASTVDRNFPATVKLGNGAAFTGQSLYTGKRPEPSLRSVVYAGLCEEGSMDSQNALGKLVVCKQGHVVRQSSSASVVAAAGAAGEILIERAELGRSVIPTSFILPGVDVREEDGAAIVKYIDNHRATAKIFVNGTLIGQQRAPVVASFSARGPNSIVPSILKPDLTAPGVSILASWSMAAPPTSDPADYRQTPFNILSGTSMACPHATGLVALLRAAHPHWSTAALKSALMTTAQSNDSHGKPILDDYNGKVATPFEYGAGQVNPNAALDPGLVYDIGIQDYIDFLCGLGYSKRELLLFTRGRLSCSKKGNYLSRDLNYPSLSVVFNVTPSRDKTVTLRRAVTNVGKGMAMYRVEVEEPEGTRVKVNPSKLEFLKTGEKQRFEVMVTSTRKLAKSSKEQKKKEREPSSYGFVTWVDARKEHRVRSPLVVVWSL